MTSMSRPCLERYVASGDGSAFEELVREYQAMVYNTCLGVLERPSADVDDAVQETFLKLARSAGSIHGNIAAWLHACARTTALDRRRRQRVRAAREREVQSYHENEGEAPGAEGEREEQRQALAQCVDELPKRDRDVVVRYYFMGQTQQQIADGLGVSQVAVQKRLTGALEVLRRRCVKRGIAVALLMAMLSTQSQAAVPETLVERLAQLRPSPGKAGLGAAGTGAALAAALIVAAGAIAWWPRASAAAATAETPTVAAAPPPSAARTDVDQPMPAPPATVRSASVNADLPMDLAKWTLTDLKGEQETVEIRGASVPALRLSTPANKLVGLATTGIALAHGGYTVDFDYRVLTALCPFTSPNSEPVFRGVDCLAKPLREVDSRDGSRSPVGEWRHYRAEYLPQDEGGSVRVSITIDGQKWLRYVAKRPGEAEDRLHLRIVDGEMVIAHVQVWPIVGTPSP
jgi:RNA polymerase sigma-70 factor (ECF subfamily)